MENNLYLMDVQGRRILNICPTLISLLFYYQPPVENLCRLLIRGRVRMAVRNCKLFRRNIYPARVKANAPISSGEVGRFVCFPYIITSIYNRT